MNGLVYLQYVSVYFYCLKSSYKIIPMHFIPLKKKLLESRQLKSVDNRKYLSSTGFQVTEYSIPKLKLLFREVG